MKDTLYNIEYKYNIQPPCSVSGIKTRWLDIVLVSEYSYLLHFIIRDQISKYLYAKIILENALFLYPFVGMMQYSGSLCFLWTESLSS